MNFQHNQTFVSDQACVFTDAWKMLCAWQCDPAPASDEQRNYASLYFQKQ